MTNDKRAAVERIETLEFELKAAKSELEIADGEIERLQSALPRAVEGGAVLEATAAQHFDLPKGQPAQFVRNGVLETCQCRDCAILHPNTGDAKSLAQAHWRDSK